MNKLLALTVACLAVLGALWFGRVEPDRNALGAVDPPRGAVPSTVPGPVEVQGVRRPQVGERAPAPLPVAADRDAATGEVVFRIRDRAGRPVHGSDWRLIATTEVVRLTHEIDRERLAGGGGLRARTDLLGDIRFPDLPARRWVLVPELDGAAAPLLPLTAGASAVECIPGATVVVDLEVERAATLHGVVRHVDGRSERAWLRATSRSPGARHMAATVEAYTEEDGTFRMFSRPGRVRLETQPASGGTILREVVRPEAKTLELAEGASHRFEFVYGAGGVTVAGRVVDQDGAAWAGLRASLRSVSRQPDGTVATYGTRIGECAVDDDGRFEFRGVTEGSYAVSFEHPDSRFPADGGIAEYPLPADFDCAGAGRADLGTSLVHRWTNVHVEGQVVVSGGRSPQALRLQIEVPPWNRITQSPSMRPVLQSARIDADGRFAFDYSAHVPGVVTYVLEGGVGESRTAIPFDVGDGDVQAVTLTYP